MKIAIVAANGKAGRLIAQEAVARGHEVTAVVGAIPAAAKHLADILAGTPVRLLVVGGAGSLFVNPEHTLTVADSPDFPADWKPLAAAHAEALADLQTRKDLKWTYISPAADFRADGPRTGAYDLNGEDFTPNAAGQSVLSYADFALAMVDEIERAAHVGERISLVQKA